MFPGDHTYLMITFFSKIGCMVKRTVISVQVMPDLYGSEIIVDHEFLRHYIIIFNIHKRNLSKSWEIWLNFIKIWNPFYFALYNAGALREGIKICEWLSLLKRTFYYIKYKGYNILAKFKEIFHNANRFLAKDIKNVNVILQNIMI